VFAMTSRVSAESMGSEQVMTTWPASPPAWSSTSPTRDQWTANSTASAPATASAGVPNPALPPASRASRFSFCTLRA
jgi:hypothetical protein